MKNLLILFIILNFFLSIHEWNLINAQSYNVAYIYNTDSLNGISFRNFLNSNNYTTSLIRISKISATNFDEFVLIMIDSRSGDFGNWGTPQEVQIIQNLNKPILALGRGGASLFEQLNLTINCSNSWTSLDTLCGFQACIKILAEDTSLSLFNIPYEIYFPQPPSPPIVQLYNNSSFIAVYKPMLSDSVLYIGRQPDNTTHYSIVAEGELYWLWGFDNSPAHMTQTGKDLFLNIIYHLIGGAVGVNDEQTLSVSSYNLFQNFPNPFNPSTKISWQSPVGSWQTLKVYDVLGNEVATLVDEYKPAGKYEVEFNASSLTSGVYFYQLQVSALQSKDGKADNYIETKKMILLK